MLSPKITQKRGHLSHPVKAWVNSSSSAQPRAQKNTPVMQASGDAQQQAPSMPCNASLQQLPGDPSLIVYTNVDMGSGKNAFMVDASAAVAQCLGKPESFVSVCVMLGSICNLAVYLIWRGISTLFARPYPLGIFLDRTLGSTSLECDCKGGFPDKLDMVFGGRAAPCALAQLNSLGAIGLENNRQFSAAFADLISRHGIPEDRYYINFFDVPRENCGYKGATFAG